MGSVNFVTDVNKNVDINKDVDLDVDKEVQARTQISGNLATAEASADAIGGGGGGGTTLVPFDFDFLLDDATDFQTTVVDGTNVGEDSNTGTAPGAVFPPPAFDFDFPDGFEFEGTDIQDGAAPSEGLRTFSLDIQSGGATAELTSDVGGTGRLAFSNDDETTSNQTIDYEVDGGGTYSVIAENADLTDPVNRIVLTDLIVDVGLADQTVRVELEFEDSGGDIATTAAYFTDDFVAGADISIPLILFLDETLGAAPDTPVNDADGNPITGLLSVGTEDDVDAGGNGVDFDDLVRTTVRILDDPDAFGSIFDVTPGENPGESGTDISIDDILFEGEGFEEVEEGDGNLAETDVFAQVTPNGAFSFGEALAALSTDTSDAVLV